MVRLAVKWPEASEALTRTPPRLLGDTSVPGDRAHPGAHEEPAPPLLHFRQPSQPRADMAEQWHLLIAHNGRQVREVLHQIFLGAGYKCLLANDGSAGLEAFRQSRPPLVITELNLPHSLPPSGVFGGIELLKQVRREDPDVAVIVVSDSPHRETATECLQLGADAYIRMPLNVDELLTAAERALRARQKYPTERGQDQVGVSRVGGQGQEMGEVGSLEYAESFVEYFEGHSEHEALFIPEATVANEVVALMWTQPLTREAMEAVWRLMVDIDRIAHYDGTGWYGFRSAVDAWLSLKGHRALPARDTPPGWSSGDG
ncbi:MAG: hypothetical protein DMD87_29315 [Candidatus Rokuibacteriota bacterium]|nr:MAG: hypothetical protein DMD87_29315 [Candidatus Rokubacteria bacterium]